MAESDAKPTQIEEEEKVREQEEERLRYLQFVHAAAIHCVLCLARIYAYAKESSGPLKSGVESVEGTVKVVVGPVVDKYRGVPLHLLKFVDRKVEESVQEFERHVPTVVKEAPSAARSAASEVQKAGIVKTATGLARSAYTKAEPAAKELYAKYEPAAKELYAKYEPTAEQYAVSAWRSLNRLPLVPQVLDHVVIPTAAQLSEQYNRAVNYSAEKGYTVSSYLPLIPRERIAKVFEAKAETAAH